MFAINTVELKNGQIDMLSDEILDYDYLHRPVWPFHKSKKQRIGLCFSGGTDSTLLFHLLCKVPNIEIFPYHGIEAWQPNGIWYARDIYNAMVDKHPNAVIHPLYEFEVKDNSDNQKIRRFAKEEIRLVNKEGKIDKVVGGLTMNPPFEVCQTFACGLDFCEERRFEKGWIKRGWSYKPLRNVDKKVVAAAYKKENLMDWLYPLTWSCGSRSVEATNYWTRPCKECYNCCEKYWAFGSYDRGE